MSRIRAVVALAVVLPVALAACGGGDDALGPGGDGWDDYAGYRRDPAPVVGDLTLPEVNDGGREFAFRAEPGELLVVYFGYTNCPDFCPTTLSDLRLATRRMDEEDAARIDVAMVTVDPDRDLPILGDYVTSFFDDGHALGTDDGGRLAEVAAPFGVAYDVSEAEDGEIEVAHTTSLYAVDDRGELALTWQFGVPIDDLAADLERLLERSA
jgi:protein SCO1/2